MLSSVTLRGEAVSRRRVISIFIFTHFLLFFIFLGGETLPRCTRGFCVPTFRGLFQRTDRELQPLSSDHAVNFAHLKKKTKTQKTNQTNRIVM